MKSISGKELTRILQREGWILLRVQGSHHIYGKAGNDVRLAVPVHKNQALKVGLLHYLLKVANLSKGDS